MRARKSKVEKQAKVQIRVFNKNDIQSFRSKAVIALNMYLTLHVS